MADPSARTLTIEERPEIPRDGLILGYGAMVPLALGAVAIWIAPERWADLALWLTMAWGAAILLFLSGVRRGLSFRTEGGPQPAQFVATFWLFGAGLVSLLLPPLWALTLQLAGYVFLLLADPPAARRGEAPIYFVRLRRPQMSIAVAALAAAIAGMVA
ncbi:DUF3429 domain-containing protein [Tranquillimonas alkanivorans]|uniref:DUF3429 domain-containing protein n=1 Tax=Tranquillimonas alkanivorans TaxID=441119 RepID=A0A1I5TDS2_9RHOB|nr:DUF3429 domain-containing protein [Tranquillimonas alkanivorans]SFP81170.1 Protein of unknown function [Tranquillimonas alkanivorans]